MPSSRVMLKKRRIVPSSASLPTLMNASASTKKTSRATIVTNRIVIARLALISRRMLSAPPAMRGQSPAKKKGGELAFAALKPTSTTIYGVNVSASGSPRS